TLLTQGITCVKVETVCIQCPENWLSFQSNCYFFSSVKKSWHSAQRSCENEGAHLVIINSLVEQNTLVKQLANEQVVWIGLSDSTTEGSWRWLDGTALSLSFWGSGEPNNAAAHEGEDCGTLIYNGKWNDVICSNSEQWICEKKSIEQTSTSTPSIF
uniref:C-type lectin domain-containing protein n=1 Tax=Varanus komodoensis TaxID=61221 RepID=A0A8D2J469_VARKO